ncbi:diguanylate cyclase [Methylomonas sp. LL1]|uniref:sensor domain-containing diguanylate cyclase n=1 Tax=Methylomonas sp. LL1 TaxID=2785785 RepID=UPI0018C3D11B|nr:diguanylate cyclase [Methylomonas sp. LL1]QPK62348.1 diguanylate cyclase [Methylomonas sp. LL1]
MPSLPLIRNISNALLAYPTAHAVYLAPILAGIGYYLGAVLGVKASIMSEGIAILWPPNAILLAALLLSPPRHWPAFACAIIPAEILADWPTFSIKQALMFASVNILEAVLTAVLLKQTIGLPVKLDRLRHVALFGFFALVLASGSAALLGAGVYTTTAGGEVSYWANWRIWWFGDGLGLLIITPVLLSWLQSQSDDKPVPTAQRLPEAALLVITTIAVGLWIFSQSEYLTNQFPVSPMLLLPMTIWAAGRFGMRGAASINLLIAAISIYCTIKHLGPFVSMQEADNVLRLQEYIAALALSSLALAALLQELQLQNQQLRILGRAIEAVNEGILIADARTKDNPIIYVNSGFEAITGYQGDEVKGRNPRFLQAGFEPAVLDKVRQAIADRRQVRALLRNRRKDGSIFWNNIIIDPVCDESGQVSHFIGIQHDITDIMETETALRSARDELAAINRDLEQRIEQRTWELKQANQKLEGLAATDPLTGAYNRRYFLTHAGEELERAIRHQRPLSVIAIDIDHFKSINDQYGHVTGDKILVALTETAKKALRPADIFARFGGEEFFILLPETLLDEAINVAERLKARILEIRVADVGFTVSIGIALRADDTDIQPLLERADQALYVAKNQGRNCIRTAA